jgi:hypothetical protein
LTDLTILANQVWSQIPQRYIQRYTISMWACCGALVAVRV